MKKSLITLTIAILSAGSICACSSSSKTISICASELPHAKILKECIANIVKEDGYSLSVKVLDWTQQNDAVANGDYDANYFQHIPYLETYKGTTSLSAICKCHFEKLCLYANDTSHLTLTDGDSIELVNDTTNIERALSLLASYNVLTINASNYDASGNFVNFSTTNPTSCVTFAEGYSKCTLTCIAEAQLCASLPDYNFGIIPGNSALTGLGNDYAKRISLAEKVTAEVLSNKANVIAVKTENKTSEKSLELVKAFKDSRVKDYIETTFGDSVIYHYENLLS